MRWCLQIVWGQDLGWIADSIWHLCLTHWFLRTLVDKKSSGLIFIIDKLPDLLLFVIVRTPVLNLNLPFNAFLTLKTNCFWLLHVHQSFLLFFQETVLIVVKFSWWAYYRFEVSLIDLVFKWTHFEHIQMNGFNDMVIISAKGLHHNKAGLFQSVLRH